MAQETCDNLDPRIRRTRQLLQQALGKLLETKDFEKISVQDIAEAATLNRATFYDHYPDKFALLECVVASRFHELLTERKVSFDGTCAWALRAMALGVCDFLTQMQGPDYARQLDPHTESAIISVVRKMILEGLKLHPSQSATAPEMIAATTSWAMYGAVKEWTQTPDRGAPDEIASTVMTLVSPILQLAEEHP